MAINATKVFDNRINDFNLTARKMHLKGKKIFQTANLHVCQSKEQSIAINGVKEKAIIISASGMVTGGRILHHLAERLSLKEHTVLFIGHQAEGTRGRDIINNKPFVKIHGREIPVNAKIENISGFSGHGDYEEILAWLMAFNKAPEKTFIVHGEAESSQAMAKRIKDFLGWDVIVPKYGESFDLQF
jgi:metallo-beta-lactamase family protein